jgi:hypothetical protein
VKFAELKPQFYKIVEPGKLHQEVDVLTDAQGVWFLCPKCFEANGRNNIGVHGVICWFRDRGVPDTEDPRPGRWVVSGSSYTDLSLSPSILLTSGCGWHGYVTNGNVTSC